METVRRGGGGSDLVVHGSLSLGPFHSEMDEELTSCLRLRVAFLLGSGSLAGVLCAGPLGHGFPVLVVIKAAVGPSDPGCLAAPLHPSVFAQRDIGTSVQV